MAVWMVSLLIALCHSHLNFFPAVYLRASEHLQTEEKGQTEGKTHCSSQPRTLCR